MAATNGLLHIGNLGCLVEAKRRGLILEIGSVLREMRVKARFWVADHLADRILRDAGES